MSTLYVDNLQPNLGSQVEIPDLKHNAGSVVQCVQYYNASTPEEGTTSTSFVGSAIRKTITPKYANSLIIVQSSSAMADPASGTYVSAKMYINGSLMSGASSYHVGYQQLSHGRYAPFIFQGQHTCTSTASLEFRIYYRSGNGGQVRITHSNSSAGLTLWEIAQ
jgi:hypothetical protein